MRVAIALLLLTAFLLALAMCASAAGAPGLSEMDRLGLLWKAYHYEQAMQARHLRDGGLVIGGVRYPQPKGWAYEEDENSAYLTGMYLAATSFRYAVTRDPAALAQAKRSARALDTLQAVTGQPYLARWYRPYAADAQHDDGWLKGAWRRSGDREWLGNTSTDQYTGAMFGYSVYYALAADREERARVAKAVGALVGRVLEGGMRIRDEQDKPTSWSDMSPESMQEPMYALVGLHLLKVAYQVTGERRFEDKYRELCTKHKYLELAVKRDNDWSWNYSDDVMSFEAFYTTISQEKDPAIKQALRHALDVNWKNVHRHGRDLFGVFQEAWNPGDGAGALALQQLVDFPADKIEVSGHERTSTPTPLRERQPGWVEFMNRTRYRVQGTEQSGVDYLLAYWMARYHRIVK